MSQTAIKNAQDYYTKVYISFCDKGYGLNDKQVTIDEFIKLNIKWGKAYYAALKRIKK